jgi:dipeptidyl aminopeptidase/acylaminoacyl peptidase
VLVEDRQADCGRPVLDPLSCRPIAAPVVHTRRRWHVADRSALADVDHLSRAVEGDLGWLGLSNDRANWIAYAEVAGAPGQFFHYARHDGAVRRLFSSRPSLEGAPLVAMRPVVVTARDGLQLVCYLSQPRDARPGVPGPLVLFVHGGPWSRDLPDFSPTHQWLANRGYSVLSVNFRGSTGFGKAFVNAGDREWAGKMHNDLIDAVDWAIGERIADAARIAIYGASYGGYSALVGATFTPTKFACAVDLFGISNLVTFANAIPPYWRSWSPVLKTRMGDHTTEEGRTFLMSRSPLSRVDRIVRPLLIGQGANDVRVTAAESEQIVAEMQRRNIPVTYVYYKDEGHGFRRVENRRSFTAVVEAFLAQHLGGRLEPIGDDFAGSSIEFRAGRELIRGLG